MPDSRIQALKRKARQDYQGHVLELEQVISIERKYELLHEIVFGEHAPGPKRWKQLAADYPGILREAEMCSPGTIDARRDAARGLKVQVGKTRAELLVQAALRPVLCWHDAHQLLKDIGRWRIDPGASGKNLASFFAWTRHQLVSSPWWPPCSELLRANAQGRPDQYTAYAWLAWLTDQSESSLMAMLVDRVGAKWGLEP